MIVLPFLLAAIGVFPPGISEWLLRLTPAAGFAIEQSIPQYSQVEHDLTQRSAAPIRCRPGLGSPCSARGRAPAWSWP